MPLINLPRRPQLTPPAKEAIPPNRNRDGRPLLLRPVLVRAQQVAADDDFGLDDGFAAEDYVGCADYLGAPGDFVACVLGVC